MTELQGMKSSNVHDDDYQHYQLPFPHDDDAAEDDDGDDQTYRGVRGRIWCLSRALNQPD